MQATKKYSPTGIKESAVTRILFQNRGPGSKSILTNKAETVHTIKRASMTMDTFISLSLLEKERKKIKRQYVTAAIEQALI
jgi:hypothetical protein